MSSLSAASAFIEARGAGAPVCIFTDWYFADCCARITVSWIAVLRIAVTPVFFSAGSRFNGMLVHSGLTPALLKVLKTNNSFHRSNYATMGSQTPFLVRSPDNKTVNSAEEGYALSIFHLLAQCNFSVHGPHVLQSRGGRKERAALALSLSLSDAAKCVYSTDPSGKRSSYGRGIEDMIETLSAHSNMEAYMQYMPAISPGKQSTFSYTDCSQPSTMTSGEGFS